MAIKAGVLPERITCGKPQENGRLERLHLTLLQDTASPPAANLRDQAKRFQAFQRNNEATARRSATPRTVERMRRRPSAGRTLHRSS